MVSPWMNNGDVLQYLAKFPNSNRLDIVCFVFDRCDFLHALICNHQIKGIACGLSLLHNLDPNPIAHGDVKAVRSLGLNFFE